jgi:hypothetical protein
MGYSSRTSVSPLAPLRPGDQMQPEDQRVALGKEPMGFPLLPETQRGSFTLCEPTLVGPSPPQRARNTLLNPLGMPRVPCLTGLTSGACTNYSGPSMKRQRKGTLHPSCYRTAIENPTPALNVRRRNPCVSNYRRRNEAFQAFRKDVEDDLQARLMVFPTMNRACIRYFGAQQLRPRRRGLGTKPRLDSGASRKSQRNVANASL